MNILVIGGTRFFGVPMVEELLRNGHEVTIATRGMTPDSFGEKVKRIFLDHTDFSSMKKALAGLHYDVVIDKVAYCSNDIKYAMESLSCEKYIYMSTTAIYDLNHKDVREEEFDGAIGKLKWCDRADGSYSEVKQQAEYALWQTYKDKNWIAVRYPYVVGPDDYTKRLLFYVKNTIEENPMFIDNLEEQMSFIRSDEAGKFIAYLADKNFTGAVNGCSYGTISIKEILDYVEKKTGKKAIIETTGEAAPYNGTVSHSVNIDKAAELGFQFSNIEEWIFELIDEYIGLCIC